MIQKKKGMGIMVMSALAPAVLKLLGIIRCGWMVALAPLIGMILAAVIITAVSAACFLGRWQDGLYRDI